MTKIRDGSQGKAWVTVVANTSYLAGCLVTFSALRRLQTRYPFVVLVNPLEGAGDVPRLPQEARDLLHHAGCIVREVGFLQAGGKAYTGPDARFADTWTKLRAVELYEYERVVLIDSDTIPRHNMDELFDLPLLDGWIAASHACTCNPRKIPTYPPDWIPSNCGFTYTTPAPIDAPVSQLSRPFQPSLEDHTTFHSLNSGLVVIQPNRDIFERILHALHTDPDVKSMRFPDQDMLAREYRGKVRFLPYEYNALKTLRSCHKAIWQDARVRNVHFILGDKPWHGRPKPEDEFRVLNGWWWEEFDRMKKEFGGMDGWHLVDQIIQKHDASSTH